MTQGERMALVARLRDGVADVTDREAAAQLEADGKRIAALEARNASLRDALEEVFDLTRRKGLPITSHVHEIASAALTKMTGADHDPV